MSRNPPIHQQPPQLRHTDPSRRQHAVLQAVEALAVDGRHEAARGEAEEDARRQVVFSDAPAQLEVLAEGLGEGEGDGLGGALVVGLGCGGGWGMVTFSFMYDVGADAEIGAGCCFCCCGGE